MRIYILKAPNTALGMLQLYKISIYYIYWAHEMIPIIVVILFWVMPSILLTNAYLKMEKEVQQQFKNEFKQPLVFMCVTLPVIGFLLSQSGIVLAIELIQHIGVSMFFIGWFASSIVGWRKGKRSLINCVGFIFLGILGIAAYIFLITYVFRN